MVKFLGLFLVCFSLRWLSIFKIIIGVSFFFKCIFRIGFILVFLKFLYKWMKILEFLCFCGFRMVLGVRDRFFIISYMR